MRKIYMGNNFEIAKSTIQDAIGLLADAKMMFEYQRYINAADQIYCSIFQAILAVHLIDNNKFKNPKDALKKFNKIYLHTNTFPNCYEKIIYNIQKTQQKTNESTIIPKLKKETLEEYLTFTTKFIENIKSYCNHKLEGVVYNEKR